MFEVPIPRLLYFPKASHLELTANSYVVIFNSIVLILVIIVTAATQLNAVNDVIVGGASVVSLVLPVIASLWLSEFVYPFNKQYLIDHIIKSQTVRIAMNIGKGGLFPTTEHPIGIIKDVSQGLRVSWSLSNHNFYEEIPWHHIERFALSIDGADSEFSRSK